MESKYNDKSNSAKNRDKQNIKSVLFDILLVSTVFITILGILNYVLRNSTSVDVGLVPEIITMADKKRVKDKDSYLLLFLYYFIGGIILYMLLSTVYSSVNNVLQYVSKRKRDNSESDESIGLAQIGEAGIKTQERILEKDSKQWGNETSLVLAAEALERHIVIWDMDPHTGEPRKVSEYGNKKHDELNLMHQPSGWGGENDHYNFYDKANDEIITVTGDGACMFRSLSRGYFRNEQQFEEIRSIMRKKFPNSIAKAALI